MYSLFNLLILTDRRHLALKNEMFFNAFLPSALQCTYSFFCGVFLLSYWYDFAGEKIQLPN